MRPLLVAFAAFTLSACSINARQIDTASDSGPGVDASATVDSGPAPDTGPKPDSGSIAGADAAAGPDADAGGEPTLPWEGGPAVYGKWTHGPPTHTDFFPISVWLQSEGNAAAYQAIGINTFIGLWQGPTEAQLTKLTQEKMPVLCDQGGVWQAHKDDPIIQGWTQQDEPDNAQPDGKGGYGPCVDPAVIVGLYNTMVGNDATRPVFLNFGQGVSWTDYVGRGDACAGKLDMYKQYMAGADIVSFDIYPMNSTDAAVAGNLWMVPQGVDRLRQWSNYQKPAWVWIETTPISDPAHAPTPADTKAEVWMALVHGAMGIGYFAHIMGPTFVEAGLLADPAMSAAVKDLDAQIQSLAPALNSPSLSEAVTVSSSNAAVPVDFAAKRQGGHLHIFAVAMRPGATTATFTLKGVDSGAAEVLGESRDVAITGGKITDTFAADWAVHLYRVR
jgi:hypothetical protein